MTLITSLLGGSWHWLAALAGIVAALVASYFGGRKIGKVQQQAKSEVESANKAAVQAVAVNQQQQQLREEAAALEIQPALNPLSLSTLLVRFFPRFTPTAMTPSAWMFALCVPSTTTTISGISTAAHRRISAVSTLALQT